MFFERNEELGARLVECVTHLHAVSEGTGGVMLIRDPRTTHARGFLQQAVTARE
jgi:hypothetical protein